MGDYYDENGVAIPIQQLTPDQRAAIQQYQLMDCIGDYQDRVGEISKIKLHNKMSALDKIARHTGFYLARSKNQDAGSKTDSKQQLSEAVLKESESAEVNNAAADEKKVLTISPPVVMEDGRGKMEDGEEKSQKNLTISPPMLMENGRGKMENVFEKNLTISPPVVMEDGRGKMENVFEKNHTISPPLLMENEERIMVAV
jgi:hypothetical protein